MTDRPPPGCLRRMLAGWSVRALLVLVALIAIVMGWIEGGVARQRSAVRAVGRAGGQVVYDWQYPRGVGPPPGPPYVPRWLVDRVGEDYFGEVSAVSACFGRSDDAVAAEVGRLEGLRELDLTASAVTDAGLAPIAGLSRLTELSLTHTGVGDEGLAHLARLTSLESLSLIGTRVTDAGLAHLEHLDRLRWLSLVETRVGDEGLAHLAGLGGLEELWLGSTAVTDAGLVHLERLPNLASLSLTSTSITDAGLEPIKRMPSLRSLHLEQVEGVTPTGLDELRKACPNLSVDWSPPLPPGPPIPPASRVYVGPKGIEVLNEGSIIYD